MSGIDDSFKYRGFLYNIIIMRSSLISLGSSADFIVMIGFASTITDFTFFDNDRDLLQSHGVIIYHLPRLIDSSHRLGFAEMALLKISPFSFTQYQKVQYMDGDVMPLRNMDCLFQLNYNSFTVGAASPLNSGWFLAVPNATDFEYMKDKSIWRLERDWDSVNGWAEPFPQDKLYYRGNRKVVDKWEYNGADMDQGLFTHYFLFHRGKALLMDTETRKAKVFDEGLFVESYKEYPFSKVLRSCDGLEPTTFFAHFTGRSKPWVNEKDRKISDNMRLWYQRLDDLKLNVTSESILKQGLGSPLGYFNVNFPKGGFKSKAIR
eukprot:gene18634-24370_t